MQREFEYRVYLVSCGRKRKQKRGRGGGEGKEREILKLPLQEKGREKVRGGRQKRDRKREIRLERMQEIHLLR